MHAAITPTYGTPDVIRLTEVPRPTVGPHDVLVEVHASPVTAGDRRLRSADFPGISALPGRLMMGISGPRHAVQGSMFAGRVVEVGTKVSRFAVGDDVFGEVGHGAYAELVAVHENSAMAAMPAGATYAEAAALPYGAGTALHFLRDLAEVQPGERVLVVGATGGVGRYAVALAAHLGAHVTAVAGPRHLSIAKELGAQTLIDHTQTDIHTLTEPFDVILDLADALSFTEARPLLTAKGRYLTVYISVGVMLQMARTALFGGPRALFTVAMPDAEQLRELAALYTSGVLRPHIAERFALPDITRAHEAAEARAVAGEVVVEVAQSNPQ
jgi:NADPH:quinone reductase-like Zn-dependent oxidoreductase